MDSPKLSTFSLSNKNVVACGGGAGLMVNNKCLFPFHQQYPQCTILIKN